MLLGILRYLLVSTKYADNLAVLAVSARSPSILAVLLSIHSIVELSHLPSFASLFELSWFISFFAEFCSRGFSPVARFSPNRQVELRRYCYQTSLTSW